MVAGDRSLHLRARVVVLLSAVSLLAGPFYVSFYLAHGFALTIAIGLAALGLVLTPVVLWLSESVPVAGNWFTSVLAGITFGLAFQTGGISAPGLVWVAALPLAGFALAGRRSGTVWTLAAVLISTGFYLASDGGGRAAMPADDWTNLQLAALLGLVAAVGALALIYESQKDIAFDALADSNRALDEAKRRADAEAAARGRFLATMSHEVRTRMSGLLGMVDLLLSDSGAAIDPRYSSRIRSASEPLLRVIDDILDFSRIDSGHVDIELRRFDVVEAAEEVVVLLSERARLGGLLLRCEVEGSVPETWVGDPMRVAQVLTNLINNALKFTEDGAVTLRVLLDGDRDGAGLRFEVRDTGRGISADDQHKLFEPFEQIGASVESGAGLGLAISRKLVESMGGEIGVQSQPGSGSTFWFMLPERDLELEAKGSELNDDFAGLRALVVEPHGVSAMLLESALATLGCRVDRWVELPVDRKQDAQVAYDIVFCTSALYSELANGFDPSLGRMPIEIVADDRAARGNAADRLRLPWTLDELRTLMTRRKSSA